MIVSVHSEQVFTNRSHGQQIAAETPNAHQGAKGEPTEQFMMKGGEPSAAREGPEGGGPW